MAAMVYCCIVGCVAALWNEVWASAYDRFQARMEEGGLADMRAELLGGAAGDVLEIGAGTGANLKHYGAGVESLVLTEPQAAMSRRLDRHIAPAGSPGRPEIVEASAEDLPFPEGRFDCVVSTLVLCTVKDARRAIEEVSRVLKPGGEFRFLEHVRSPESRRAAWQDRLNPLWRRIGNGCECNRDLLDAIKSSPLEVTEVRSGTMPRSIPIVSPYVTGVAVKRPRGRGSLDGSAAPPRRFAEGARAS